MSVFDKLRDDDDPWEGDPEPMVKAPAVPVRRFKTPDRRESYWPADLFFAVLSTPEGHRVFFVPMDWWQRNGYPYPDHIRLVGDRPDFLREDPVAECSWAAPDGFSPIDIGGHMADHNYIYNTQFENYLVAEMNGLDPNAGTWLAEDAET